MKMFAGFQKFGSRRCLFWWLLSLHLQQTTLVPLLSSQHSAVNPFTCFARRLALTSNPSRVLPSASVGGPNSSYAAPSRGGSVKLPQEQASTSSSDRTTVTALDVNLDKRGPVPIPWAYREAPELVWRDFLRERGYELDSVLSEGSFGRVWKCRRLHCRSGDEGKSKCGVVAVKIPMGGRGVAVLERQVAQATARGESGRGRANKLLTFENDAEVDALYREYGVLAELCRKVSPDVSMRRLLTCDDLALHGSENNANLVFLAMEWVPGKELREWLESLSHARSHVDAQAKAIARLQPKNAGEQRELARRRVALQQQGRSLNENSAALSRELLRLQILIQRSGLQHRDLKPENILVLQEDQDQVGGSSRNMSSSSVSVASALSSGQMNLLGGSSSGNTKLRIKLVDFGSSIFVPGAVPPVSSSPGAVGAERTPTTARDLLVRFGGLAEDPKELQGGGTVGFLQPALDANQDTSPDQFALGLLLYYLHQDQNGHRSLDECILFIGMLYALSGAGTFSMKQRAVDYAGALVAEYVDGQHETWFPGLARSVARDSGRNVSPLPPANSSPFGSVGVRVRNWQNLQSASAEQNINKGDRDPTSSSTSTKDITLEKIFDLVALHVHNYKMALRTGEKRIIDNLDLLNRGNSAAPLHEKNIVFATMVSAMLDLKMGRESHYISPVFMWRHLNPESFAPLSKMPALPSSALLNTGEPEDAAATLLSRSHLHTRGQLPVPPSLPTSTVGAAVNARGAPDTTASDFLQHPNASAGDEHVFVYWPWLLGACALLFSVGVVAICAQLCMLRYDRKGRAQPRDAPLLRSSKSKPLVLTSGSKHQDAALHCH